MRDRLRDAFDAIETLPWPVSCDCHGGVAYANGHATVRHESTCAVEIRAREIIATFNSVAGETS